jgi:hypothetical protein
MYGDFPSHAGSISLDHRAVQERITSIATELDARDREIEKWRSWASHQFGIVGNNDDLIRIAFTEYAQKLISEVRAAERLADFATSDRKKLHSELTTARAAAVRECVEEVKDRLSVLEAQTASLIDPPAKAGCYGRDSAIREIVAALESLLTQETQPAHDMD